MASAEGDTGKSTVAVGMLAALNRRVARVGAFRPVRRTVGGSDDVLEMLLRHTTAAVDESAACGVTDEQVAHAADPAVAAAKMPDSPVAGRATVFVFPDLNTGNSTYEAVQRSSNALAIGPVLQGLNRPINDLSRGALVRDIVNTIAITAIQARSRPAARTGSTAPTTPTGGAGQASSPEAPLQIQEVSS